VPSAAERRVMIMANHSGKGWLAILLGKAVDCRVVIPPYIVDAIRFAANMSDEIWLNVLRYRVSLLERSGLSAAVTITGIRNQLDCYEIGIVEFADIRTEFRKHFPADAINNILDRFP
jgi:putative ATP-dependent endonuclease of the OLD family